jgi:hypothetical protein
MKNENTKDKLQEAQELLKQAHQKKVEECGKEIQAILDKYGFRLDITKPQIVLLPQ